MGLLFPCPPGNARASKTGQDLLNNWQGCPFLGKVAVRTLHSDSSQHGWAGIDTKTGSIVQEYWRDQGGLHINVKELQAATHTVRSLAKPGEVVHLCVDNSVTYYYLKKGGEDPPLECNLKTLPVMVHDKQPPSAGFIGQKSRLPGRCSFKMGPRKRGLLPEPPAIQLLGEENVPLGEAQHRYVCQSRQSQIQKFISRFPHWQAIGVDSLHCPLDKYCQIYANPPWSAIAN